MCGILGYLGDNCADVSFERALDTMTHRGPDGSGIYTGENILLGHRRLSIVDLSNNAAQPMLLGSRYAIVFNGEIYNYKEIQKELIGLGCIFSSNSDTEVVIKAFEKWGVNCFKKFNGMWALGIWDAENRELTLARDRMGKKPLFYGFLNNTFFFASEMKALYGFLPEVEIDKNLAQLAILDGFCYESTDECLIKGIQRFPAGSVGILKYNSKKLIINSNWNPYETQLNIPIKYSDKVDFFKNLFLDACKIRMQSDVPIGTALSGGLDSSSVICSMAHIASQSDYNLQKNWQHAFVASFPGTSIDETEYAKKVTNYLGIESHFIDIDPVKELNNIYFQTYQFEELFFAPTIPFVQLYRNIKENNVTVSIDGHGADELFGGYPFDVEYALLDSFPNPIEFLNVASTIKDMKGLTKADFKNYFKYALKNKYPFFQKISNNVKPIIKDNPNKTYLANRLYESTFKTVLPTLLRNYDRYSMMNSVEIRMPFLDYRIVEFAFNTQNDTKLKNGYSKNIIRDALYDIVPHEILFRKQKIGFNSPMNHWIKNEMKEWIIDTINSKDFEHSELINGRNVKSTIMTAFSSDKLSFVQGQEYFALLAPFIWEKSLKLVKKYN